MVFFMKYKLFTTPEVIKRRGKKKPSRFSMAKQRLCNGTQTGGDGWGDATSLTIPPKLVENISPKELRGPITQRRNGKEISRGITSFIGLQYGTRYRHGRRHHSCGQHGIRQLQ